MNPVTLYIYFNDNRSEWKLSVTLEEAEGVAAQLESGEEWVSWASESRVGGSSRRGTSAALHKVRSGEIRAISIYSTTWEPNIDKGYA